MVPCYLDLMSLQQMFGARIEDEDGTWQEKVLNLRLWKDSISTGSIGKGCFPRSFHPDGRRLAVSASGVERFFSFHKGSVLYPAMPA